MVAAYCEKCDKKVALKKSGACSLCGHKITEDAGGAKLKPSEILISLLFVFALFYFFALRPALDEISPENEKHEPQKVQNQPKEIIPEVGIPERSKDGKIKKLGALEGLPASKITSDWHAVFSEKNYDHPFDGLIHQKAWVFKLNKDNDGFDHNGYDFAYPHWDKTVASTNQILDYLGLPRVTKVISHRKNTYTDPNYPNGEITLSHGRYCDCLSAINIRIKQ